MIDSTTPIKVFNHGVCSIGFAGQLREYMLPGAQNAPTVLTMPFSEVEYIHSRTTAFSSGALQFDPEVRDEVYKALYFDEWKDRVLFDEDIAMIIRNNDLEGAAKFLAVKDLFTMQRIRGHMVGLVNDPAIDVSQRMIDLIEKRYDEINHGIRDTKIQLGTTIARAQADEDPRIAMLQKQLLEMQEQMKAMAAAQPAEKKTTTKRTRTAKSDNSAAKEKTE